MDINRGSRRARHVAAAAAANGSNARGQPAVQTAMTTPTNMAAHRTPEQPQGDGSVGAPPPHPFRLHRCKSIFSRFQAMSFEWRFWPPSCVGVGSTIVLSVMLDTDCVGVWRFGLPVLLPHFQMTAFITSTRLSYA